VACFYCDIIDITLEEVVPPTLIHPRRQNMGFHSKDSAFKPKVFEHQFWEPKWLPFRLQRTINQAWRNCVKLITFECKGNQAMEFCCKRRS
jgi:hypothetical protein